MTWFIGHMSENEDVYRKVLSEVDAAFDEAQPGELVGGKMLPYFSMALSESMRITPSVFLIPIRKLLEPMEFDEFHLAAGVRNLTLLTFIFSFLSDRSKYQRRWCSPRP